jgi:hypothetical protein
MLLRDGPPRKPGRRKIYKFCDEQAFPATLRGFMSQKSIAKLKDFAPTFAMGDCLGPV